MSRPSGYHSYRDKHFAHAPRHSACASRPKTADISTRTSVRRGCVELSPSPEKRDAPHRDRRFAATGLAAAPADCQDEHRKRRSRADRGRNDGPVRPAPFLDRGWRGRGVRGGGAGACGAQAVDGRRPHPRAHPGRCGWASVGRSAQSSRSTTVKRCSCWPSATRTGAPASGTIRPLASRMPALTVNSGRAFALIAALNNSSGALATAFRNRKHP